MGFGPQVPVRFESLRPESEGPRGLTFVRDAVPDYVRRLARTRRVS